MRPASSLEAFFRAPVGHWVRAGQSVVWVRTPELMGMTCWGTPLVDTVQGIIRVMEHWDRLAPRFDVVQDVSRVDAVDPEAFDVLFAWVNAHREGIRQRVRRRVSVLPPGLAGFALAGIGTVVQGLDDVRIMYDAREGYRFIVGNADEGRALYEEIAEIVASFSTVAPTLAELRTLLLRNAGAMTLAEAARAMSISTRSLQRELTESGTSFRAEVHEARFRAVAEMLRTSDQKIVAIAARLGITEPALARLIRDRTGQTPGELRAALRAG